MDCIRSDLNPHFFVSHIARAITLRAKEKKKKKKKNRNSSLFSWAFTEHSNAFFTPKSQLNFLRCLSGYFISQISLTPNPYSVSIIISHEKKFKFSFLYLLEAKIIGALGLVVHLIRIKFFVKNWRLGWGLVSSIFNN